MRDAGPKDNSRRYPSLKHPGRWLWLILALPVLLGFARLRFDVEVFNLLPAELPEVKGLLLYQEHFTNARELIITLTGPEPEKTERAAQSIAELLRQNNSLAATVTWEPPWLERPEQSAELIAYLWLNQPPQALQELTKRLAPEKLAELLASAREELSSSLSPQEIARLSYDPFGFTQLPASVSGAAPSFAEGQDAFASPDGTFRIIFVQATGELRTYRECADWLGKVQRVVDKALQGHQDARLMIGYTGRPAFVAEIATAMERDMTVSVGGTAVIIAILFWLAHRRIKPMLWLLTLLAVVLASTLALGGLIYGSINVVSMGFAAILLGLAVDYAVVHYQEALAHPTLSVPQIRHAIAPSIFWAAATTIAAFLVLNFGGLPGLGQLGTLVALGVTLAATVMIFEFLPPLFPGRRNTDAAVGLGVSTEAAPWAGPMGEPLTSIVASPEKPRLWWSSAIAFTATAAIILVAFGVLTQGIPGVDASANALRPRHSAAYAALDEIQSHLNDRREPLWLIVKGSTTTEVSQRLDAAQNALHRAVTNGLVTDFTLPTPLWPRVEFQADNRASALALASMEKTLQEAAASSGFSERSLGLAQGVMGQWRRAAVSNEPFWPSNSMSRWIFEKFSAKTSTNFFALGLINVSTDASTKLNAVRELKAELSQKDMWLSGWPLLGGSILDLVSKNFWKVVLPMVGLVLVSLIMAFRRPVEILLSLAVLSMSGVCLLAVMRVAGWSWNLLNLMAVPLILGTGVDYGIFMQLALRRHGGDLRIAYESVGRALLLCGGTAIAGFGSLALSSNAGMASLGRVCAAGIAFNMLIGVYLLPTWWKQLSRAGGGQCKGVAGNGTPSTPSSFYRAEIWKAGLWLVRILPRRLAELLGKAIATAYWAVAARRRRVVVENLMPACLQNRSQAQRLARELFNEFSLKVLDLWSFEAGLPIEHLFGITSGWEHFQAARDQKRGILLLTPHLGNWEFGGPLLTRKGFTLQVITLSEPGRDFTALRQASRARWKIETLVIGENPLAFVDVIHRLESGATVALLVDRPPPSTSIKVELFGQPFEASIAAAELARASGCVLLPVYLPRVRGVYEAHILPPIEYDRAKLRDREARRELTQRIIGVFEPLIREHADQWYHFVPVWPRDRRESAGMPANQKKS